MGPVDSRQVPRDWRYSGNPLEGSTFRLQGYHLLWPGFPAGSTICRLCNSIADPKLRLRLPQPHIRNAFELTRIWFGLNPFRSPLLGVSMFLSFPAGTEMVQFPAFPTAYYGFICGSRRVAPRRFRISEIPGSKPGYGSPRLIAVNPRLSSAPGAKASSRALV